MFQQPKWFRQFIKRHTKPIPEYRATLWKNRLSIAYALIAWNAFGFVCYMIFTGRGDWAKYYGYKSEEESLLTPAQQWTKTLGIKDATVYRISGFNVQKYKVHNDFETGTFVKIDIDSEEKVEDKTNIN
ncbi:hypothetical protein AMK59_4093 [Oryctes borbonicus]|uniref:Uncharacterized protein n=1 Tax=Oryctes borbonicus TaxID=1629725 RepID=A0A0T6B3Y8_9SCAR|nr:hypothetical protein AMK59_4093 [Oryctes borbonicus]